MQCQSQPLQSGGNFLWEVSSLEIVFSRRSKTTFAKTARRSITISFAGTATASDDCAAEGALALIRFCAVTLCSKQSPWKLLAQFSLSRERDVANILT